MRFWKSSKNWTMFKNYFGATTNLEKLLAKLTKKMVLKTQEEIFYGH
jgi:hypothetical protein